jgi:exodeoxyribonuclease VII small subunit
MKKDKLKFEQALARLEDITRKLEDGQAGLDESLKLFSEGIELSEFCNLKLEETRKKIEILVKSKDGKLTTKQFSTEVEE